MAKSTTTKRKKPTHPPERNKNLPKEVREQLVHHTAELYLKGWSYRMIQKDIEKVHSRIISLMSISNYVKQLLTEWREWRVEKLDDLKTVELNRIHKLEQTYWEGWERSLDGTTKSSSKKQGTVSGTSVTPTRAEELTQTIETPGDPRFLDGIQWCIKMRCEILGVKAPIEIKGNISVPVKRTVVWKVRDNSN